MEGYRQLISLDYIKQIKRKKKDEETHTTQQKLKSQHCIFSSSYDLSNLKLIGESLYKVIL